MVCVLCVVRCGGDGCVFFCEREVGGVLLTMSLVYVWRSGSFNSGGRERCVLLLAIFTMHLQTERATNKCTV